MRIKNNCLVQDAVRMIWLSELSVSELKRLPMKSLFVACEVLDGSGQYQFQVAPCYVSDQSVYERVNPFLCVNFDDIEINNQPLFEEKCHFYTSLGDGCYEEDTKVFDAKKNKNLPKVNQICKKF